MAKERQIKILENAEQRKESLDKKEDKLSNDEAKLNEAYEISNRMLGECTSTNG